MWIIFKVFIEPVTRELLFYVLVLFVCFGTRYVRSQLPDQGSNSYFPLWKVKSLPLDHQGSPDASAS